MISQKLMHENGLSANHANVREILLQQMKYECSSG